MCLIRQSADKVKHVSFYTLRKPIRTNIFPSLRLNSVGTLQNNLQTSSIKNTCFNLFFSVTKQFTVWKANTTLKLTTDSVSFKNKTIQ